MLGGTRVISGPAGAARLGIRRRGVFAITAPVLADSRESRHDSVRRSRSDHQRRAPKGFSRSDAVDATRHWNVESRVSVGRPARSGHRSIVLGSGPPDDARIDHHVHRSRDPLSRGHADLGGLALDGDRRHGDRPVGRRRSSSSFPGDGGPEPRLAGPLSGYRQPRTLLPLHDPSGEPRGTALGSGEPLAGDGWRRADRRLVPGHSGSPAGKRQGAGGGVGRDRADPRARGGDAAGDPGKRRRGGGPCGGSGGGSGGRPRVAPGLR